MNGKITRLSDMITPQIGATSGGIIPTLHESDFVEGQAEYAPQIEEAEYRKNLLNEQMKLDEDARRDAARDSRISLGIEGANTVIKAYPLLSKLGGAATKTALDTSGKTLAVETAGSASSGSTGIISKLGSGVSKYAGPVGAGFIAADIGGDKVTREIGKLGGIVKNKNDQKNVGRALKGAAAGAAYGSFLGPVGTIGGGIVGAIGGWAKGLFD